jgi:hypothetical protein
MADGQTIVLTGQRARQEAARLIEIAPAGAIVNIRAAKRTNDQNSLMWALLSDISRAKPEGRCHTPEVWKALMMHACGHAVQFEMGLNGQPFPTGFSSSRLTKAQMTDLIDCIFEFGARHGVRWSNEREAA